jgi:hypothetical protein
MAKKLQTSPTLMENLNHKVDDDDATKFTKVCEDKHKSPT